MLYGVKQLHGYKLRETNGDIGDVREVYFDDQAWCVRYFIVETGTWLFGRKVLISPVAVTGIDSANAVISVNLTREQVKNSPDISTDAPISRLIEARLSEHYGWPGYWGANYGLSNGMSYPFGVTYITRISDRAPTESKVEREVREMEDQHIQESHLRGSHEVTGYHAVAKDGDIGHVEDFVIDDVNWSIRYLVVDAGGWLSDRKVLLATEWIESISWGDSRVYVHLQKAIIANSPPYDPSQPITREYETRLFASYQRPGYWETPPAPQRPVPAAVAKTPVDLTPQIAKRAYELYEMRGRQDGQAAQDWAQAEQEIRNGNER